jgi:serine/threonine protein kinase
VHLGRYEIENELGRGSMGVVFQARDPRLDRRVALKVLKADLAASETFVRRFLKEARAAARLTHPSIVSVYDADEDRGTLFIAMELLAGESLDKVIQERKLSEQEIVVLGIQVARVLDYAHQSGIIHRDIKPGNIILDSKGQIKITDFGVARIEDPAAPCQTVAGEVLGTPAYMSPEQALGRSVDGRTDIYSLGVVLYELSTGVRPFRGETLSAILMAIIHDTPPEPESMNAAISPELARIIMRCMSKEAERRFETGEALADALEKLVWRKESNAPPPPPTKGSSRRLGLYLVTLLLVLGIGGGFSYHLLTKRSEPSAGRPIAESIPPPSEPTKLPAATKPEATFALDEAKRKAEEFQRKTAEAPGTQRQTRTKEPETRQEVASVSKSEKVGEKTPGEGTIAKEALPGTAIAKVGFPPVGTEFTFRIVTEKRTYKRSFTVIEDTVFENLKVHRVRMEEKDVVLLYDTVSKNWMGEIRDGKITMLARPHDDLFRFPLYVGQKHQARYFFSRQGENKTIIQSVEVKSFEKVAVPAGTFEAFRIQADSKNVKKTFWYSPELKICVKRMDWHRLEGQNTRELTKYRSLGSLPSP